MQPSVAQNGPTWVWHRSHMHHLQHGRQRRHGRTLVRRWTLSALVLGRNGRHVGGVCRMAVVLLHRWSGLVRCFLNASSSCCRTAPPSGVVGGAPPAGGAVTTGGWIAPIAGSLPGMISRGMDPPPPAAPPPIAIGCWSANGSFGGPGVLPPLGAPPSPPFRSDWRNRASSSSTLSRNDWGVLEVAAGEIGAKNLLLVAVATLTMSSNAAMPFIILPMSSCSEFWRLRRSFASVAAAAATSSLPPLAAVSLSWRKNCEKRLSRLPPPTSF
uniref:Uncharacterized protein n=1 Tax=Anopheles merus TaxID=30066 RepID=A0A182VPA8_ANOME